jgi:hypothetical protein
MPTRKSKASSRGKIQFESPHYRVYEKQPHLLYIAKDASIPNTVVRDTRVTLDAKKYVPHKYKHEFTSEDNDCLRFAEALAKGVVRYTANACVYDVEDTGKKFGVTDVKNMDLARKNRQDAGANPVAGQAFAIVRTNLRKALREGNEDLPPYHIAHVIQEDGDWRVTLEADAGNPDLDRPSFGIYSIADAAKSFHNTYKDIYGEDAAATIVLEKASGKN